MWQLFLLKKVLDKYGSRVYDVYSKRKILDKEDIWKSFYLKEEI